jgi:hypothetical protein
MYFLFDMAFNSAAFSVYTSFSIWYSIPLRFPDVIHFPNVILFRQRFRRLPLTGERLGAAAAFSALPFKFALPAAVAPNRTL